MALYLLNADREELAAFLSSRGEPAFRAKQLWQWIHTRRVADFADMTNLSKNLRATLSRDCTLRVLDPDTHQATEDGLTGKWLFRAPADTPARPAGPAESHEVAAVPAMAVETVLIREKRLTRRTVCVSSMVGCPLGCAFCATGQHGYERPLARGEMIEQVYRVDAHCRATERLEGRAVSHVVFMGMGEPLLNYDEVIAAVRVLGDEAGLNLSNRHITLSTIGIPSGIDRLVEDGIKVRLALSLHAPNQSLRERLLPATRQWPLPKVLAALKRFSEQASRDVTLEYCLIHRVNDSKQHAAELIALARDLSCKVNLIPLNPTDAFDGAPPPPDRVRAFQDALERGGLPATVRVEKGQDIDAACGQLRSKRRPDLP